MTEPTLRDYVQAAALAVIFPKLTWTWLGAVQTATLTTAGVPVFDIYVSFKESTGSWTLTINGAVYCGEDTAICLEGSPSDVCAALSRFLQWRAAEALRDAEMSSFVASE